MTQNGRQAEPEKRVPAVVRASKILDLLSEAGEPLGVSDLARQLDLPKSSVHLLCMTMIDLGLLSRRGGNTMGVGPHVLAWADAFQEQSNLIREFQNAVPESSLLAGLALNLTVLSGADVLYVACRNGNQPLGVRFAVGMRLPAVFTATGKAMLSTMGDDQIDDVLRDGLPEPITRRSVRSRAQLARELEQTRARGYSLDNGQLREGMHCLAAPIFTAGAETATAGIAIGLLESELTPQLQDQLGAAIAEFAGELSRRLGART